ncbi:MAG TPA: di-trans,poly-cis-decaprenylcistransferase [Bryobacteraceae bacterium]|jgi:undecaprenyl diphosphate synthase
MFTNTSLHVAIIMDGNGRWARRQNLPRLAGHRAGAESLRKVVEAAPKLGVGTLTVYAFSADNWRRPEQEVKGLMSLFGTYLKREVRRCVEEGIRVSLIGRRDRLPERLLPLIDSMESETARGRNLHLRLAIDYSSRDAILEAVNARVRHTRASLSEMLGPDVDFVIRTSGEQRLSDFLLWECAYAEMYFTDRHWPEFEARDLEAALEVFHLRSRRFGALGAA